MSQLNQGPVVIADGADNPGSGAAGDSTIILCRLLERGVGHTALGPLWDPVAVRIAFDAGVGARLPLRLGGKKCAGRSGAFRAAPVFALSRCVGMRHHNGRS